MRGGWGARVAGWLVPDDERGRAILGDLEELHASWRERRGSVVAAGRVVLELMASFPALVFAACLERRDAGLLARSAMALALGGLVCLTPLFVTGAALGPVGRVVSAVLMGVVPALAGGWLAAAVAGAAPRQHALAVGLVAAATGAAVMGGEGAGHPHAGVSLLLPLTMTLGATLGGAWYRRSHHPGHP